MNADHHRGHPHPNNAEGASHSRRGPHHADHHHDHEHGHHPLSALRHFFGGHSHDVSDQIDGALEASKAGIRALWISLGVLGLTAVVQLLVVLASRSVALFGDMLHNFGDALTAVPLGLAFVIGRRPPTDRFTYGYGRGEELAGLAVVLIVAASAVIAGWEAISRLLHPAPVHALDWVAAAAVAGFVSNEIAAQVRIRTGDRIGSAALVADGLHARTDGITSLAVLLGAAGVAIGWNWADPVVGLGITAAIALVARNAALTIWQRLMDGVDPDIVRDARRAATNVDGVESLKSLRVRWIGHQLHGEAEITAAADQTLSESHRLAHQVETAVLDVVPRLTDVVVHVSPTAAHKAERPG